MSAGSRKRARRVPDELAALLRPAAFARRRMRIALRAAADRVSSSRPPRLVPRFILIGAMKAGTTSLFNYLAQHPRFAAPMVKEIDHFNFDYARGGRAYAAHFPRSDREGQFTGEASTGYLSCASAAERIATTLPGVKLIALLRHPVDRAISHYFHEQRARRESRSLAEAMRAPEADAPYTILPPHQEARYLSSFMWARWLPAAAARIDRWPVHRRYLAESRYERELAPWLARFDEWQLRLVRSETLFASPRDTLVELLDFLELDQGAAPCSYGVFNEGGRPDVPTEDRALVQAALTDSLQRMPTALGPRFSWD